MFFVFCLFVCLFVYFFFYFFFFFVFFFSLILSLNCMLCVLIRIHLDLGDLMKTLNIPLYSKTSMVRTSSVSLNFIRDMGSSSH